jgi:uncharacterized membrane protein
VTLRRLGILQWTGLLLGAVIWFAYHIAGFGLTEASCDSVGWNIHHDLWQTVGMVVAALVVLAATAAATGVLLQTRDASYEAEPPIGRIRFFAIAAVTANVLFLMIVLLDGIGAIFNVACRQA